MKQKELLAQIIGGSTTDAQTASTLAAAPAVISQPPQVDNQTRTTEQREPRSTRQIPADTYDRYTRYAATVVSLCICLIGWCVGAYFTVQWFQMVIPTVGLYAWLLPIGITAAETGFWPKRASGLTSRLFWLIILGFDAYTTAAGILPALPDTFTVAVAWASAAGIGILLAIAPEKAGRALVKENFSV